MNPHSTLIYGNYDWLKNTATPTKTRNAMWIKTEGQHAAYTDAAKLERLYVSYKGNGNYAIIGAIGSQDTLIKTCANAKEATDYLGDLVQQLGSL